MALLVHIASVWVPFTSESKEAVAHYPDIIKEIQLAAQECGRKLATFIRKGKALEYQAQRRSIFELYIEEVATAIGKITNRKPGPIKREFLKVAHQVTAAEMKRILADVPIRGTAAEDKTVRSPIWQSAALPHWIKISAWRLSLVLDGLYCDGSELTNLLHFKYQPWREAFGRLYAEPQE